MYSGDPHYVTTVRFPILSFDPLSEGITIMMRAMCTHMMCGHVCIVARVSLYMPLPITSLFLETTLLIAPGTHLFSKIHQPMSSGESHASFFHVEVCRQVLSCLFYIAIGIQNSRPHICTESTSLADPPPQCHMDATVLQKWLKLSLV